jgi:Ca-activated chloride channel family protein
MTGHAPRSSRFFCLLTASFVLFALAACSQSRQTGATAGRLPGTVADMHPTAEPKKLAKRQMTHGVIVGIATSAPTMWPPANTERYEDVDPNPVKSAAEAPVSTFSIDVDTAAYANVRRFLRQGVLPPRDAVRVEEMVNYFDYAYHFPPTARRPSPPASPSCRRRGTRTRCCSISASRATTSRRPSVRAPISCSSSTCPARCRAPTSCRS